MADEVEVRHLPDGLRADPTDSRAPRLSGYALRFNSLSENLGGWRERIEPSAVNVDQLGDLVALFDHDSSRVLGRAPKTLRVAADDQGLRFDIDLPSHEAALAESVARGDIRGASFAFRVRANGDRWDDSTKPPTRTLTAIELREISVVAFPAFSATSVVALRSLERHQQSKEPTMPELIVPPVADPIPPIPPVVTDRSAPDEAEVRVLGRGDSFRSWVEERTKHPAEYGHLRLGDYLRSMVTGPRSDLEKRVLSESSDAAGGFSVPDILLAPWYDRLRAALVVAQAGVQVVPLTSDVVKAAKLLTDPVAAWRSENAAVAESDPTFGAVSFTPRSLDVFTKVSRELLEDSINISEMLEASLVRSFASEIDRVVLHGTGVAPQPLGLRTTAGVQQVSMGTNGLALTNYDPLLDLLALLWGANVTPDPVAIMAPRTLAALEKLKTATTLEPLPRPPALADWRFLVTSNMSIAETQGSSSLASSLYMGDWSQALLGWRTTMQVEIARELYRTNYQYGFFAHLRFDVQFAQPAAFGRVIGIL